MRPCRMAHAHTGDLQQRHTREAGKGRAAGSRSGLESTSARHATFAKYTN